jgi:hypothetical protein
VSFAPDSLVPELPLGVRREDHGRCVVATCELPASTSPQRITALVTVKPVPKGEREMWDRWDRAGSLRLRVPGARISSSSVSSRPMAAASSTWST